MSYERLRTEYRGHRLIYYEQHDIWGPEYSGTPIGLGPLNEVRRAIDKWECEKLEQSGIKIWYLEHSDPKHWGKRCAIYYTPGPAGAYPSRHELLTRNAASDPDSVYAVSFSDSAADTPEVAEAIEAARKAYDEAVEAGRRFKQAKRAIPRLKPDDVAGLPPRPGRD